MHLKTITAFVLALFLIGSGTALAESGEGKEGFLRHGLQFDSGLVKFSERFELDHRGKGRGDQARRVPGEVKSVSGSTFTIDVNGFKEGDDDEDEDNKLFTVTVNASTTVTQNGKDAVFSDISVGEKVLVSGVIDRDDRTIAASSVFIVVPVAHVSGKVQAISGNTITVIGKKHATSTIEVTADTMIRGFGKLREAITSLADISIGQRIFAFGKIGSSATTSASANFIADLIAVFKVKHD